MKRVVAAQDMGIVINPEGARMQMEGCITMGLGYVLSEELRFRGGQIDDVNFDTYKIPRFSWVPRIETVLVKNDELSPQGGGEPGDRADGSGDRERGVRCGGRAHVSIADDEKHRRAGGFMDSKQIGEKLVGLCSKGKNIDAIESLYSKDVVSVEAMSAGPDMPAEMRGIDKIKGKNLWWVENHEVHSCRSVEGPFPDRDRFSL